MDSVRNDPRYPRQEIALKRFRSQFPFPHPDTDMTADIVLIDMKDVDTDTQMCYIKIFLIYIRNTEYIKWEE